MSDFKTISNCGLWIADFKNIPEIFKSEIENPKSEIGKSPLGDLGVILLAELEGGNKKSY